MTALVLLACVFAVYRISTLLTRDQITKPLHRRLARRYPSRIVPMLDPNGDPALIRNDATQEMEQAVQVRPHPLVAFLHCDRCLTIWLSLGAVLACHGVGLLDRWPLVGLGWLGVAGAVALVVDVVG
jgi:hypothetical protein